MKKFLLIPIVALLSSSLQAQDDVINDIRPSFKAGNAKEVSKYFNDIVEIIIDGEKGSYSKTQGEFILKDFFRKYPPSDYQKVHQGSSKEGLTFTIGKYIYSGGSYRVYILIKQFRGNYLIDTVDFSKE